MLTVERLREVLRYDPALGFFEWRSGPRAGKLAGHVRTDGYVVITVDYQPYLSHRLAWFHTYARWPVGYIDHIDGRPGNDRLDNLRQATPTQSRANSRPQRRKVRGRKGVYYHKQMQRWTAAIGRGKDYSFLGYFDSSEEAHAVYVAAAENRFGEFARTD